MINIGILLKEWVPRVLLHHNESHGLSTSRLAWLHIRNSSGPRQDTRVNKGALVNTRQVQRNGDETTANQVQCWRHFTRCKVSRDVAKSRRVYLSSNLQRKLRRRVVRPQHFNGVASKKVNLFTDWLTEIGFTLPPPPPPSAQNTNLCIATFFKWHGRIKVNLKKKAKGHRVDNFSVLCAVFLFHLL